MAESEKYQRAGAYHWRQANSSWRNKEFNPLLCARYMVLVGLVPQAVKSVVDIGCGDGYLMHLLRSDTTRHVLGVDVSRLGVKLAYEQLSRQAPNGGWSVCVALGKGLPILDNSVDAVIFADVVEHLEKPEFTLREIYRVLKGHGTLLVSTPNWNPKYTFDRSHVKEYTPDELEVLLRRYFSHVRILACWPMWWFWRWIQGGVWRRSINMMARLGYNPFLKLTQHPSLAYGQLLAVCRK